MRILYVMAFLLTRLQLLNRHPPFGLDVLASAAEFPQFSLSVKEKDIFSDRMNPVQVHLLIECGLVNKASALMKPKKQSRHAMSITAILTLTSDMDMIDFRRIPSVIFLHSLSNLILSSQGKSSDRRKVFRGDSRADETQSIRYCNHHICQSIPLQLQYVLNIKQESIAGVTEQQTYRPNIPATEYPVLDTKPLSSVVSLQVLVLLNSISSYQRSKILWDWKMTQIFGI